MTVSDLLLNGYKHWNDAQVLVKVGAELEERSRFQEARLFLNRAFELDNSIPEIYLSLAFTHFRDVTSSAETGEEVLVDGIENTNSDLLKAWHIAFVEENEIANQMVKVLSESTSNIVQLTIANSLLWRGEIEKAYSIATSLQITDWEEKSLSSYTNLMIWLFGTYKHIQLEDEIAPLITTLIHQNPKSFSHQNTRLMLFQSLQEWSKVADYAKQALLSIPDNETLMLALAIAYENLGDLDNAIQWYNRAIGAKHSFVRARLRLANLLHKQMRLQDALSCIMEISYCNPHYYMGHIQAAFFLYSHGDKKEAVSMFTKAYAQLKPYEKQMIDAKPQTNEILAFNSNVVIISPSLN